MARWQTHTSEERKLEMSTVDSTNSTPPQGNVNGSKH